jgi:hypothetical protein
MSDIITVFIENDGNVSFLDSPLTAGFNLGPSVTRRYSSVEPDAAILRRIFQFLRCMFGEAGRISDWTRRWTCVWRAQIKSGPLLSIRSRDRQQVISAEIAYFNMSGVQR